MYEVSCWRRIRGYFTRFWARRSFWWISKKIRPIYYRYTPIKHTFAKYGYWLGGTSEDFYRWMKENKPEDLKEIYIIEDRLWRKGKLDGYFKVIKPYVKEYYESLNG